MIFLTYLDPVRIFSAIQPDLGHAEDFLRDPQVREWLGGVEPAWTLLTFDGIIPDFCSVAL